MPAPRKMSLFAFMNYSHRRVKMYCFNLLYFALNKKGWDLSMKEITSLVKPEILVVSFVVFKKKFKKIAQRGL